MSTFAGCSIFYGLFEAKNRDRLVINSRLTWSIEPGIVEPQSTCCQSQGEKMRRAYSYSRFSSVRQMDGDSKRRQLETAKAACERHGWILDDALMLDAGVSGWTGANMAPGAELYEFIQRLRNGQIESGSVLIIEALDRLTRNDISYAIEYFTTIINTGCDIYVAMDDKLLSKDLINQNIHELYIIISLLIAGNLDSANKADRLHKMWKEKRRVAREDGKPLGRKVPMWIKLSDDGKEFEIKEEPAKLIRLIFDLYAGGIGTTSMARWLNNNGYSERYGLFTAERLFEMLKKSTVIGTLTHRITGKLKDAAQQAKLVPEPVEIPDYYPPIIDLELWNQVQWLIKSRNKAPGPKGKAHSNLFSGLVICGECGGKYRIMTDRDPKYARLICITSQGQGNCSSERVRYLDFETELLDYVYNKKQFKWVDPNKVSIDPKSGLVIKREELQRKIDNLLAIVESGESLPKSLLQRINDYEAEIEALDKQIKETVRPVPRENSWHIGKNAYWQFVSDYKDVDKRALIAQSLRSIIVSMVLDPHPELWEGDERLGEAPINKRKITIDWGNEVDILFVTDTGYLQKKLKVNQLDRIDKMVE